MLYEVITSTVYTIRTTNHGSAPVTGAVLQDVIGSGLSATDVVCSTAVVITSYSIHYTKLYETFQDLR